MTQFPWTLLPAEFPKQVSVYVLVIFGGSVETRQEWSLPRIMITIKESGNTKMNTLTDNIYSDSVLSESGALLLWAEKDSRILSALVPVPFRVLLSTLCLDSVKAFLSYPYQMWHMPLNPYVVELIFNIFWHKLDLSGSRPQCDKTIKNFLLSEFYRSLGLTLILKNISLMIGPEVCW